MSARLWPRQIGPHTATDFSLFTSRHHQSFSSLSLISYWARSVSVVIDWPMTISQPVAPRT
jgi:hypothetical protein